MFSLVAIANSCQLQYAPKLVQPLYASLIVSSATVPVVYVRDGRGKSIFRTNDQYPLTSILHTRNILAGLSTLAGDIVKERKSSVTYLPSL
jgi:hypothetical protein